jgi:hypothetical protein
MLTDTPTTPENTTPTDDESQMKLGTVPCPSAKKASKGVSEKKSKKGQEDKRQRRASPKGNRRGQLKPASSTYRPDYKSDSKRDGRLRAPTARRNDDGISSGGDRRYRKPRSPRPPTPRAARDDHPYRFRPIENESHNNGYPSRYDRWTQQPQAGYGSV